MNKFLLISLFGLIAIIVFELGYYFFLSTKSRSQNAVVKPSISTSPSLRENLNIMYRASGDDEGRTIVYDNKYGWSGIGRQIKYPWIYVVGLFDRFEDISGSNDQLLYLNNPLTGKEFDPIRIMFDRHALTPNYIRPSGLMVENLNKLISGESETELVTSSFSAKIKNNLTSVIHKGDAIVVFLASKYISTRKPEDAKQEIKDDKGYPFALWLTIRRYEGSKNITL